MQVLGKGLATNICCFCFELFRLLLPPVLHISQITPTLHVYLGEGVGRSSQGLRLCCKQKDVLLRETRDTRGETVGMQTD